MTEVYNGTPVYDDTGYVGTVGTEAAESVNMSDTFVRLKSGEATNRV